jgi:hypothetical protein
VVLLEEIRLSLFGNLLLNQGRNQTITNVQLKEALEDTIDFSIGKVYGTPKKRNIPKY